MRTKRTDTNAQIIIPLTVDVDLVRFEKNLLQIGFFGSHDSRHNTQSSRRIEQIVYRGGNKVKVAAEFRGSEQLGLPSTSDRDKFIAFLKIVSEQRAVAGRITNPISFSGYRMIRDLGLARTGEMYEDIMRWGKRMTDTTITSEKVVYFAVKKFYSDEVLHVFRSFRRTGNSNTKDGEKQETFEVVLEDWLLDNLNQRYVIPENFNDYKKLKRPTAKGIFGHLHLWFHASQGKPVEKDYSDLCLLLNIPAYKYQSKIESTMGLALDELKSIHYLSKWSVQPMSSKVGFKIVLSPGRELLAHLSNSRPEKKQLDREQTEENTVEVQSAALESLIRHGIIHAKAEALSREIDPDKIVDVVEYVEHLISTSTKRKFDNPAGFIIYFLENDLSIPATFVTGRVRRRIATEDANERSQREQQASLEVNYVMWRDEKLDEALTLRFSKPALEARIKEVVQTRVRTDEIFKRVPAEQRTTLARQLIKKEVQKELNLPDFEQWKAGRTQFNLF